MRVNLFTYCLLLFAPFFLFSQNPLPFPDSAAVWNTYSHNGGGMYESPIGTLGDTLINGQLMTKLYTSNDSFFNPAKLTYEAAVLDSNNQWYFLRANDSVLHLLYDFNLAIGDTLPVINPWVVWFNPEPLVVLDIDSVLVQGTYRKRWKLDLALSGGWQ